MKLTLLLFTALLISCSKHDNPQPISPTIENLPVFSSADPNDFIKGIHPGDDQWYNKKEGFINGKTTPEYVKSVKWYVVDNYMGNGCWFITAVHNNHSFHLPNVTLEEYNKYAINTFITGDQLFNILNRVNYWK